MERIYERLLLVILLLLVFHVGKQRKKEKSEKEQKQKLEKYLVELISCYRKYRNVEEAQEEARERAKRDEFSQKKCWRKRCEEKEIPYEGLVRRLCELTKEVGDQNDKGTSIFIKNLSYIRQELKEDLLYSDQQKYNFSGLSKLCIIPFFLIPCLAIWAGSVLDSLAVYYQGEFGILTTTICFGVTAMAYELVAWCEMPDILKALNYKFERKLLQQPVILAGINKKIQKNFHKYLVKNETLKLFQGYGNIREFLLKKICNAIFFSVIGIFFLGIKWKIGFIQIENQLKFPQMYTLLETSQIEELEKRMQEQFRQLCQEEISMEELEKLWKDEKKIGNTVIFQIKQNYQIWQKHQKKISSFLWVIPFGVWGYLRPELLLYLRHLNVKRERMEETCRMQTIFLILAQNKAITVEQILEEMEESAVLFQKALQETVDHFSFHRSAGIEKLREAVSFAPMGRICDTLQMCEEVGVEVAGSGLEEEREYTRKQYRMDCMEQMKERAALAKLFAYFPFMTVLALKLILPFVVEGLSQLHLYSNGVLNYF